MDFFDLGTFLTGTTSVAWAINDEPDPIIVGEGNLLGDCDCPPPIPPDNNDFLTVAYRLALTDPPLTLDLAGVPLRADPDEECDFQTYARDVSTPLPPPLSQLINVAGFSDEGGTFCTAPVPCDILKDATVWFQNATIGTALNDGSAGGSECRGAGDLGGFSGWRFDSDIQNECQPEAVYWHTTGAAALNLGTLIPGGGSSLAERITSIGGNPARRQVVGWRISTPSDGAFLWECSEDCGIIENWTLTDLNAEEVIGPCSENWSIKRAYDVNDSGVIIASGSRGQGRHALLLTPDPACCPADLDGDGTVGASDQLALLAAWGACPNCGNCGVECPADLDCNCNVGASDLAILIAAWGPCPGSDHGSSDALEQAVEEMGYDDVEDYEEWLAQASEPEALASGWVLYALLTDGE